MSDTTPDRWRSWQYNVVDKYKDRTQEEIREDLKRTCHPFSVMMEHWKGDFNIGTLIRNANAFNVAHVFYYGRKQYDRRGTVGTHHYVDLNHMRDHNELLELKKKYVFVCLENTKNATPIEEFEWPENSLMIFGEEGEGISQEILDIADYTVSITQYGSVRSMNVGTTSGIAMYDFVRKHNK